MVYLGISRLYTGILMYNIKIGNNILILEVDTCTAQDGMSMGIKWHGNIYFFYVQESQFSPLTRSNGVLKPKWDGVNILMTDLN